MDNLIFQRVFDIIQKALPEKWDNLVFYAGYFTGSYSMKFYVKCNNAEYVDCYNLPNITTQYIIRIFLNIDKILSSERTKEDDEDKWTVMTMKVKSDGNIKTIFDYSDIDKDFFSYERNWKKKYLT